MDTKPRLLSGLVKTISVLRKVKIDGEWKLLGLAVCR
jgi:hypothetical protein